MKTIALIWIIICIIIVLHKLLKFHDEVLLKIYKIEKKSVELKSAVKHLKNNKTNIEPIYLVPIKRRNKK